MLLNIHNDRIAIPLKKKQNKKTHLAQNVKSPWLENPGRSISVSSISILTTTKIICLPRIKLLHYQLNNNKNSNYYFMFQQVKPKLLSIVLQYCLILTKILCNIIIPILQRSRGSNLCMVSQQLIRL